jgi:hypothetical protein
MFKYGYFVRFPDGRLLPAGQDWGPTPDTYKKGDSLGIKNGREGIVYAVVKGGMANQAGVDVLVVVEERVPLAGSVLQRMSQMFQELRSPRLTSRPQMQAEFQGKKIRAVRNSIYIRPEDETFYDFQINLLLWTLGKKWFDAEMSKPLEQRHIILQWRHELNELLRAQRKLGDAPTKPVSAPLTGDVKALQVLADDIYQLEHALKTPRKIIERLRDSRQFQGARYEIAVASIIARCGFEISFIDDHSKKTPEFVAYKGEEQIAVEAKSRHRPGVLQHPGKAQEEGQLAPANIKHHYEEALQQNPGNIPFLVFIDVNAPLTPDTPPLQRPWVREAMACFDDRRQEGKLDDPDTGLVLTNFGWHYYREPGAPPGEVMPVRTMNPQHPLPQETWELLDRALNEYGLVVDQEEHEKAVRARYPEFRS